MVDLIERVARALGGKPSKNTWQEDCDMAEEVIAIVIEEAAKVAETHPARRKTSPYFVYNFDDIATAIRALAKESAP